MNKKEKAEYDRVYYLANQEKVGAWQRAYYIRHSDKIKAKSKAYHQAHPEQERQRWRKYIALKLGNGHEPYAENYIFERDSWICGICGRKINKRLKHPNPLSKSIDHIVALSKGGNDSPSNVQASHLRCNMLKHARSGGQLRLMG